MTNMATEVTPSVAMTTADGDGGAPIAAFASKTNFETAQRMANALANSTLVPTAYRGNVPNVLIAMELASRVGASVFAVMQNLDIIHGNPSWRAKFLIATVNASGRFSPLRFRFSGVEGSETWGCRAVAKDVSTGEECVGPLVTLAMARSEEWSTKKGSKWLTLPELMLMYRSAAFWTRVYAPELSLGMSTAEEMSDVHGETVVVANLPSALVPGSTKDLEAELMGTKPTAAVVLDMPIVDYHPDTGEIVPS